jgi:hypothetical protein
MIIGVLVSRLDRSWVGAGNVRLKRGKTAAKCPLLQGVSRRKQ